MVVVTKRLTEMWRRFMSAPNRLAPCVLLNLVGGCDLDNKQSNVLLT